MAYIPETSSVVAFQSDPTKLLTHSSVSGTLNITGTPSISGTVNIGIIPGSVVAFQGGAWTPSVSGTVGASIVGQLPAGNAIIGAVAASISGTVATTLSGNPSISGTVNIAGNPSISGTVVTQWSDSSVISVPVGSTIAVLKSSSIIAINAGSVITINPGSIITVFQNSSLIAINAGSVLTVPTGSTITVLQAPSIVGTYAEDAGHTTGDKGVYALNVRNDTLASITSADLDYSARAVGPSGEAIAVNAPYTKWVQGVASMASGISQPVIAAQGASVFTYITGIQLVNTTATNAFVTFLDSAAGNKIGFSAAPANGGSNLYFPNGIKTLANGAFHASINALASVLISAQGFISKT